ncbi:nuclear transport factor 2 family protein [Mycobacterium avium]|uniref:nuclear transport factor 2 family protein n=1 Tax=Mycobacterium avium TaxID=1764 RepID=UPI0009BD2D67|nr:nuclear transport factor 2 family protein [Mycobacterium avium]
MKTIDIVREFYSGVIEKDLDRINAVIDTYFADDAVVRIPQSLYYGGEYRGKPTLKQLFSGLAHPKSAVRADSMQLERICGSGDSVAAMLSFEWRGRGGDKLLTKNIEWFTFQEGRIIEICAFYEDTARCVAVDQAPGDKSQAR